MSNPWEIQTVEYDKTNAEGNVEVSGYGQISILLNKYVLKEKGKGLSSNDFTDNDKLKLDSVEVGAEKNKLETLTINGGTKIYPNDEKNINLPIPTKVSQLDNDLGYAKLINMSHDDNFSDSYVGKAKFAFQEEENLAIGKNAIADNDGVAIGKNAIANVSGVAIGADTSINEVYDVNINNELLHNVEENIWEGKITEADKAFKNDNGTNLTELDVVIENLAKETQNRIKADNVLQDNINTEKQNRIDADNVLSQRVSSIEEIIPSQASTSNKLADKAFVNSTIQTNTANFRGNWNTWSDIPTDINLYPQDYAGGRTPTVNDYLVVQDASDYPSDTLAGEWRFKYTGVWSTNSKIGWMPEYRVNEEPFTSEQWFAINSGITSTKVSSYDSHVTNKNNPHSVTKSQVGLGSVVNTGDSATPVSGGTTKFTTGGAYTELNKVATAISTAETNAKNLANATGTLAVANGGTGATTAKGAQKSLLSDIQTETTEMDDTTEFVMKYGTPTDTKGALFKRSATLVWNYIKGKISSVLGLTKDTYGGKSAKSSFLDEYVGAGGTRLTSGNIVPKDASEYGGMRKDIVTDSMTDSGRPGSDGHLLTMFWDNSARWDTQFFVSNESPLTVKARTKAKGTDYGPWKDIITSDNIGSQTVASAGNATTADKATNDGNGNNIVNTYALKSDLQYTKSINIAKADGSSDTLYYLIAKTPSSNGLGNIDSLFVNGSDYQNRMFEGSIRTRSGNYVCNYGKNNLPVELYEQTNGTINVYWLVSEAYIRVALNITATASITIYGGNLSPVTPTGSKMTLTEYDYKSYKTLPVERGGTGATTNIGAEYNLIGSVATVETDLTDSRYFALRNETISSTNGSFRWNKVSKIKKYTESNYWYGTCSTASATVAKTVTLSGFELVTNVRVTIKFTNSNTATNATLNINSTGDKAIYYHGTNVPNNIIVANSTINLVYNGTQYEIVGDFSASSSSIVTGVKGEAESTYRSGNVNITKSNLGLTTDEMGMKWYSSNITSGEYNSLYYANGIWVIGSNSDSGIKYSTDGKTWSDSNVTSGSYHTPYYANGIWVIGSDSGSGIKYSTDGISWSNSNITSSSYTSPYYANGIWVIGSDSDSGIKYSTDGKTWSNSNITSGRFPTPYYANGIWVIGGSNNNYGGGIKYSTDGKTWSNSNVIADYYFTPYYANGIWVISGNSGIKYSTDGKTWTSSNITSGGYTSPYYANGIWVIGSSSGIKYSTFNSLNDLGSAFKGISELKSYTDKGISEGISELKSYTNDTFATKSYVNNHKLFL